MERREVVRLLGAIAAVPFLPGTAEAAEDLARAVHRAVQAGAARFRTFTPAQQATVSSLADALLPATDTPGALDVQVPEFIDHIVTEWASEAERLATLAGLDEIESRARQAGTGGIAALSSAQRDELLRSLDGQLASSSGAGHAWSQVKSLAVFGYFTSAVVQRDVLRTQILFGAFEPCAPAA
jgi:hypothetical protein